MKVKELILKLKKLNPNKDVVFWDKQDNWDINFCHEDSGNDEDVILYN
tara:strand:+ start:683 stop:826 length:144 start_codon:yes stop_codon:yes gene_type:complete